MVQNKRFEWNISDDSVFISEHAHWLIETHAIHSAFEPFRNLVGMSEILVSQGIDSFRKEVKKIKKLKKSFKISGSIHQNMLVHMNTLDHKSSIKNVYRAFISLESLSTMSIKSMSKWAIIYNHRVRSTIARLSVCLILSRSWDTISKLIVLMSIMWQFNYRWNCVNQAVVMESANVCTHSV